jgi:hypothetical protein
MNMHVRSDDLRKSVVDSLAAPSEDIARHVLAMAGASPDQIEKSITTGSGLVAYDLQAPAKNLAERHHPHALRLGPRRLPRPGRRPILHRLWRGRAMTDQEIEPLQAAFEAWCLSRCGARRQQGGNG